MDSLLKRKMFKTEEESNKTIKPINQLFPKNFPA